MRWLRENEFYRFHNQAPWAMALVVPIVVYSRPLQNLLAFSVFGPVCQSLYPCSKVCFVSIACLFMHEWQKLYSRFPFIFSATLLRWTQTRDWLVTQWTLSELSAQKALVLGIQADKRHRRFASVQKAVLIWNIEYGDSLLGYVGAVCYVVCVPQQQRQNWFSPLFGW